MTKVKNSENKVRLGTNPVIAFLKRNGGILIGFLIL